MKHWLLYLQGGLLILLLWGTPVHAQSNGMMDGHVLDQVELSREGKEAFLVIRGIISPALLSSIKVVQKEDSLHSTISIPNGFFNNVTLPPTVSFRSGDVLESIQFIEDILENGAGGFDFQAKLLVTSSQPVLLNFDESRTNSQQIVYRVIEKGSAGKVNTQREGMQAPLLSETKEQMSMPKKVGMEDTDKILLHPVSAMLVFQRPSVLHLSILNASPRKDAAQRLAILMDRHQRRALENRLDMKLDITNISSVQEQMILHKTKIYFRPNYLTAALALAHLIPGEQVVEEMSLERRGRLGLDVEIYVGANFE
ncbi:MAG: hypothetical protein HQM14_02560 [SAR324 cluster bacterium]|nr:hypothetical protein [SAR324 cluster bacterium]